MTATASTSREAGRPAGRSSDYLKPDVREFLLGNARMFLDEYHVDGFRFDQVTVIDQHEGGWRFCQDLTSTLRFHRPDAALIAEYWGDKRWLAVTPPPGGMGFHLGYSDLLRDGVCGVLSQAAAAEHASVHMDRLRPRLERPYNVPFAWQAYNCIENHDLVLDHADGGHRQPRIAQLADWNDPRSWYARSRARVATGLLLTAPGVPMLFMGQEFLADRWWSDDPNRTELLIRWPELDGGDRHTSDFHRFCRDLIRLRRRHPALRSDPITVYPTDDANRVLAFHRWLPDVGRDVVVVVSLREKTFYDHSYRLGFPLRGHWHEVFNSDLYDHFPNPWAHGNPGGVNAQGGPMHGMPHSAGITIPANGVIVFARDHGDQPIPAQSDTPGS